jgi:hypothetical protein
MIADYPLLPVRRRFWERVLRAVDSAGTAGQLRTQLRVVHEAVGEVADMPLGTVVAADRIYKQLVLPMRQSGTLLREVEESIAKQDDGSAVGALRSRLAATIFLISQLPTESGLDVGVRATPEMLADLLVEDLKLGSATLRKQIPILLQQMLDSGELMQIGIEYRLQTRDGAALEKEFRRRYAAIFADDPYLARDRTTALTTACSATLKDITFAHGAGKTVRKIELSFSVGAPSTDSSAIPVWVRDEWSVAESTVQSEARAAGVESPLVSVFLPKHDADALRRALAGAAAAAETLTAKGTPATDEGHVARKGMETRRDELNRQVGELMAAILHDGRVFQGGGNEIVGADLRAAVSDAMQQSVARLYPLFAAADFDAAKWAKVKDRARQGAPDAMKAIEYAGDVEKHAVCQAVLSYVGAAGKKGADVRKNFASSPYGWQVDAVDGALLSLLVSGFLRAISNSTPVGALQLDNQKIGITEFRAEGVTVSPLQKIAVRKLLIGANLNVKANEESASIPSYIAIMTQLAASAGGNPPLPAAPSTAHLDTLKGLGGNEQVVAVYDQRVQLDNDYREWTATKREAAVRLPRWETLQRLLHHAVTLPVCSGIQSQADAINANRSLLNNPDPVPALCAALASDLRVRAKDLRDAHIDAYSAKIGDLENDPVWQRLDEGEQTRLRRINGLTPVDPLSIGKDDELLNTLDATPLKEWENKTAAISERIKSALLEAARRVQPKAERVILPSRTLNTATDVDTYLTEVRTEIMAHIEAGHPVVI